MPTQRQICKIMKCNVDWPIRQPGPPLDPVACCGRILLREAVVGEERVLGRMKRQHGVISRDQALDSGLTEGQIKYRLRTGEWVAEARGVYRHAAISPTVLSRLLAICLAHNALASHRSAAALHGVDGYSLDRVEIVVPSGRSLRVDGVRVHESTQMGLARPTERRGVPCTGLPRTVLDLAGVVTRKRLDRTIDAVLRDGQLRPSDLYGVLASHARRGAQWLRSPARLPRRRPGRRSRTAE